MSSNYEIKTDFSWFENCHIYQLIIDRFAGTKKFYSYEDLRRNLLYGNIKSLITKLDYIKSLNFNMIWISPFFVNPPQGYHGYHVINFNHVDPRFAFGENPPDNNIGNVFDDNDLDLITKSDEVLIELIEECHKRNIYIMMDMVPNHCNKNHPFFLEALKDKNSKYRNWFYFIDEDNYDNYNNNYNYNNYNKKEKYLMCINYEDVPKLNLDFPDCGNYIIKVIKKYLKMGINAVRIDHCIGPSISYLKRMTDEIHKEYPKVPIIGECLSLCNLQWKDTILSVSEEKLRKLNKFDINIFPDLDDQFLDYFNVLDGLLDFSFQYIIDFFCNGDINEEKCRKMIFEHYERFKGKKFILIKNVDSHDCDRILFKCKNNFDIFWKVLNLLYEKFEGRNDPLVFYYGTEDFMSQDRSMKGEAYGDHRCRKPMQFIFENFGKMKSFFDNQKK